MINYEITPRLKSVADFVRKDTVLYDIGSDHAYLPSYLLKNGMIPFAYVCDIAKGPLKKAEKTLREFCVYNKAEIICTDGLNGIDLAFPCDISICGMGGELIAKIISEKPELKNPSINLILQPMTRAEVLREYLYNNCFTVHKEITVNDGKLYTVMLCSYVGKNETLSVGEMYLGKEGIRTESTEFLRLCEKKLEILQGISEGKRLGGSDHSYENELIAYINKILEEETK